MSIKTSIINIINNQNKSFVQAGFVEPSIDKEKAKKAGLLFFLIEINQPDKIAEKMMFIITQLLEKNYYLNEKIFLVDEINGLKVESVFESALVKTNRELLEFIDQERINFNFKTLNLIVGLEYNERIYFSSIGQNKSFLISQNEKGFNISDINPEGDENEKEELISGKIFSSIISGEIPEKSYIVFTNDSLSQYLINDNFIKILSELKLDGATEQMKVNLGRINNYSNFCALFLQNCPQCSETNTFHYSESDLNNTKENTEKLLETPGNINKEIIKKKTVNIFKKINIFKPIIKALKSLFAKIKIKKEDNNKNPDIVMVSSKQKKIRKILFIIVLLLLIALLLSIFLKKKDHNEVLEKENVSNYEELIIQKQNQIKNSLLYNNETQAGETINELKEILNSLSDKEKSKIKDFKTIEETLNEQIRTIQGMYKIDNPEEIINFKNNNEQSDIKSFSLNSASQKIYAADGKNHIIYSLNLNDKTFNKISQDEKISGNILSGIEGDIYYFLADNQLISVGPEEKVSFSSISIENRQNISSFDVYNGRTYLLDKERNQILKYEKDGSKYTDWLKKNDNIEPISIITDYEIYLLNENGIINKYLSGNKDEKFELEAIAPKLETGDIMKINNNYISVFDKTQKRLVIFSKTDGLFINQYSSDKFNDVRDFAIDDKNKKTYFLNDNTVYSIDLIL
jgi:hypothetical protein